MAGDNVENPKPTLVDNVLHWLGAILIILSALIKTIKEIFKKEK